VRSLLQQRITEIVHAQAQCFGVKAEIDYRRGYAALINSKDETDFARQIGAELVGAERVVPQARRSPAAKTSLSCWRSAPAATC
jgi:hippurate hydrolase